MENGFNHRQKVPALRRETRQKYHERILNLFFLETKKNKKKKKTEQFPGTTWKSLASEMSFRIHRQLIANAIVKVLKARNIYYILTILCNRWESQSMLLKQNNLPPLYWALGRIKKIHPGTNDVGVS
uniref:DUF5641 domain-containing protein n=1 Tax=Vespula pensylvanica TaxID=30213 RepID=A0A834MW68_VESPE|nr:hypothetical protein H0235_018262 [Vespula pensylvanica]